MDLYKILSAAKKWPKLQLFQGKWGRGGVLEADGNPTVKKPRHFSLSANMCQPGLFQRRKIDNPLQALVFATIH